MNDVAEGPDPEYLERVRRRMEHIDRLSPELRELVHEHGYNIVQAFLQHDVFSPSAIRHIIDVIENQKGQGNTAPDLRPKASDQARQRIQERFQVKLTDQEVADIVDRVQQGYPKARFVERKSNRQTAFIVRHRGRDLGVIYDRKDKCLVTVVYAERLLEKSA